MSSADGFGGPGVESPAVPPSGFPASSSETLLVETLIHLLIEKGLLTKNDALSIVQTVAEVQQGRLHEGRADGAVAESDITMLRRMYDSFEILDVRATNAKAEGGNIYRLRPPLHDDRPAFPADE